MREYLPLARKLASRWRDAPEPFEDLVQVATLGLLGAIDRFDPDRGVAFTSFAIPTILGELKRHFRDHCWKVHVTRSDQELALAMEHGRQQLMLELGRAPNVDQLAEYLEISAERALVGLDAASARQLASLDELVADEAAECASLGETLGREDDHYALVDARLSLLSALAQLGESERELLGMHFQRQLTQRQIGVRLGVSQMQVSRLIKRTLDKLGAAYHDAAAPAPESRAEMRSTSIRAPSPVGHKAPAVNGDAARRHQVPPTSRPPSRRPPSARTTRITSARVSRPDFRHPRRAATETRRCRLARHDDRGHRRPRGRAPPPRAAAAVPPSACSACGQGSVDRGKHRDRGGPARRRHRSIPRPRRRQEDGPSQIARSRLR